MNKNDQNYTVERIRAQYVEKKATELDDLRELDAKVKRPATVFAYVFGSVAAIIMGAGMSLIMTDFAQVLGAYYNMAMPIGISIGLVGLTMALINHPIYYGILSSRKKKYAQDILAMSDKIINENKEK